MYCLCVNVYCTTATGWLPNCSYQIYHVISYHIKTRLFSQQVLTLTLTQRYLCSPQSQSQDSPFTERTNQEAIGQEGKTQNKQPHSARRLHIIIPLDTIQRTATSRVYSCCCHSQYQLFVLLSQPVPIIRAVVAASTNYSCCCRSQYQLKLVAGLKMTHKSKFTTEGDLGHHMN